MDGKAFAIAVIMTTLAASLCCGCGDKGETPVEPAGKVPQSSDKSKAAAEGETLYLPAPVTSGGMPLSDALDKRASVRSFWDSALTREEVSQLLWAALGEKSGAVDAETGATGIAPSAGGLDPLYIYVLEEGTLSRYEPGSHALTVTSREVDTGELESAALGQSYVAGAPALFVIAADIERTRGRYADRAECYVSMEAGHAAQNLLLEATALGLGSVPVGAFDDSAVARALGLPEGLSPLYLLPVGR